MKSLAWSLALVLTSASAMAAERVYTPEGWYQVEDEAEPAGDEGTVAVIIVHDDPAIREVQGQQPPPPQPQPGPMQQPQPGPMQQPQPGPMQQQPPGPAQPQPAPPPQAAPPSQEGVILVPKPSCAEIRGRYLERVMVLHGLDIGLLDPEELAVLTYTRPPVSGGNICFGGIGCLPAPALAPLYGLPPVPPGALSYDLELKGLFRELLDCLKQERGGQAPAQQPQPPPMGGQGQVQPPARNPQPRQNSL